jgi:hypothetical protein
MIFQGTTSCVWKTDLFSSFTLRPDFFIHLVMTSSDLSMSRFKSVVFSPMYCQQRQTDIPRQIMGKQILHEVIDQELILGWFPATDHRE